MKPKRRAEVVAELRRYGKWPAAVEAADALERDERAIQKIAVCESDCEHGCALETARIIAALAAPTGAPRPSESSMVQRIEAQDGALRKIIGLTAHDQKTTRADAFASLNHIRATATRALDGPPDPERDREERSEVERP